MKCILLCAGYATRLFPLTENFPKALLEVGGRAILDYTLDEVNTIDEIDQIYLVTNAKYATCFEKWAKEKDNIKPITVYNDGTYSNEDRLGAIGDIEFTIEKAKIDDDILILATDNLFTFKLKDFFDFYKTKNAPSVCVVKEENVETLKKLGVAEVDENMRIIGFVEKPSVPVSDYAVYAEYIYPKNIIPEIKKYLDAGNSCDAPGKLIEYMYKKVPTYAYAFDGVCYDIGTHDSLAFVNELYSK
ncbi:MAG: nucleotidyltransferase family protein [Clostridia bacterium]